MILSIVFDQTLVALLYISWPAHYVAVFLPCWQAHTIADTTDMFLTERDRQMCLRTMRAVQHENRRALRDAIVIAAMLREKRC